MPRVDAAGLALAPLAAVQTAPAPAEDCADPVEAARDAGLRYVTNAMPGIRRQSARDGFVYLDPHGSEITDPNERLRIKSLAIPPAWTDVWICPDKRGHLQATGRDARGRKQYRYHGRWRQVRDEAKFERLAAFAEALPCIRQQVERDFSRPGLPKKKVLAALVKLLEETLIRVGNDEYARVNESYGLTTMQDHHARIAGAGVQFVFRGKSGKDHRIHLHDRRLAAVVKRCRDVPGQRLFQYVDDGGEGRSVYSEDVNDYLRGITGRDFTAKDFRTWYGTVLAGQALLEVGSFSSKAEARRQVKRAIESVAGRLGNTPAVCRKCYVHPAVIEAYLAGSLRDELHPAPRKLASDHSGELSAPELAMLRLLRRHPLVAVVPADARRTA